MDITNFQTKEVKLHDEIVDYLNDKERKQCYGYHLTEDGCNTVLNLIEKYDKLATQTEELQEQINILIQHIWNNMHWCPFKDEARIDYECVGFTEKGCKECILENINELN